MNILPFDEAINELDWHGFDEFSWLGELESVVHLDGGSEHAESLKMLSKVLVGLHYGTKRRTPRSLHVYVSLGMPTKEEVGFLINREALDGFYQRFFGGSSVSRESMCKFFSENVTAMIVRRIQTSPKSYRSELVGAITFSRPRDRQPTYLAYMAVSNGLNRAPSLQDKKIQKLPVDAFSDGKIPPGYQGLGLGGLLIRVMERLVASSIQRGSKSTLRRLPSPECFLHYNNNNSHSADGWLNLGFLPVLDESFSETVTTHMRRSYQVLADYLSDCPIFKASHDDPDNCTTMVTEFSMPKSISDDLDEEVEPWFVSFKPTLEAKFIATKPSTPFYALDESEIVAKYTDPADNSSAARCAEILDHAWNRYKFCSGKKNLDEGPADEPLVGDSYSTSSSSSSSSSVASSSDSSESSESPPNDKGEVDTDDPVTVLMGIVPKKKKSRKAQQKMNRKKQAKKARRYLKAVQTKKRAREKAKPGSTKRRKVKDYPTQAARLDTKFTDQEFIDFACLQDSRRTFQVDPSSLVGIGSEKLVTVWVDSYELPDTMGLNKARTDGVYLTPQNRAIRCNWGFLRNEVVPEVFSVLDELVLGIPTVEGIGLDHIDPDVARRDVDTMASFHGTFSRVTGFLSPPVSHVRVKLPVDQFGEKEYGRKDSHAEALESMEDHRKKTKMFEKHVLFTLKIKEEPPPLPRSRYQISRLKWIPTEEEGANKMELGYFQGAYKVAKTAQFSLVSLQDDWVFGEFAPTFIKDVKLQALQGPRSARRLVEIPPGDSREENDKPPPFLLLYMRPAKFQQKNNSTCLVDAFSSAVHEFGCTNEVEALRKQEASSSLSAANKNIWGDFANLVNRFFKPVGLQLFKIHNVETVEEMMNSDDRFVIIASLKANDGSEGQHAVAIFGGAVYDANCRFALQKSQMAFDWCCGGGGVSCTGFHKVYKLLPVQHKHVDMHVFKKRLKSGRLVRGWVVSKRPAGFLVQFTDGEKREATPLEVSNFHE
jgi:hypothetical protein